MQVHAPLSCSEQDRFPSTCVCCPEEWSLRPLKAVAVQKDVTEFQYCMFFPTITNCDSCDENVLILIPDFAIEMS